MANPQPTPFVRFSKELYEAFYMNPPSTIAACRLWLWVLRWTWADFGKDETKERSRSQIAIEVGMSKAQVIKELAALVRCRRLKVGKEGGYAIQKDYDLWREDTKKRARHFGNMGKQETLFPPVDNLGITSEIGSYGEPGSVHRGTSNRFTVAHSIGSPYEPPIRSKNTVKTFEKGRANESRPTPQILPNGKKDTPRHRAELGNGSYDPSDHASFGRLSFKIQDDLVSTWKESREKARAAECRKGCGRQRASNAWPFCRECTSCSKCSAIIGPGIKFHKTRDNIIFCESCFKTREDSG